MWIGKPTYLWELQVYRYMGRQERIMQSFSVGKRLPLLNRKYKEYAIKKNILALNISFLLAGKECRHEKGK